MFIGIGKWLTDSISRGRIAIQLTMRPRTSSEFALVVVLHTLTARWALMVYAVNMTFCFSFSPSQFPLPIQEYSQRRLWCSARKKKEKKDNPVRPFSGNAVPSNSHLTLTYANQLEWVKGAFVHG